MIENVLGTMLKLSSDVCELVEIIFVRRFEKLNDCDDAGATINRKDNEKAIFLYNVNGGFLRKKSIYKFTGVYSND